MSSRSALAPRAAARREKHGRAPAAGIRAAVRAESAANDDKPTSDFSLYGDPLFGMAIATVILFAVLAALVAFI